jgi:hypothetical protein
LFEFSALPPEANDVAIDIQQGQFKEASGDVTPGAVLATFKGQVRNAKYVPGTASAFRRRRSVEDMLMKVTDGKSTIEIGLLDPEAMVLRNELQITVRGTVAGKAEFFQGKAAMFVHYPLATVTRRQIAASSRPTTPSYGTCRERWSPTRTTGSRFTTTTSCRK